MRILQFTHGYKLGRLSVLGSVISHLLCWFGSLGNVPSLQEKGHGTQEQSCNSWPKEESIDSKSYIVDGILINRDIILEFYYGVPNFPKD